LIVSDSDAVTETGQSHERAAGGGQLLALDAVDFVRLVLFALRWFSRARRSTIIVVHSELKRQQTSRRDAILDYDLGRVAQRVEFDTAISLPRGLKSFRQCFSSKSECAVAVACKK
jgi:hypothetical protein